MANIYESEVLYKLMERDGLNIPSSVPPYESEIKAYLIEQVKLAYPKLNDYEAEWLLYNYTKHIPAEFPIETVTNVTNATVNNVVPYGYKSATLKGCTLKNLNKVTVKEPSYQTFNNSWQTITTNEKSYNIWETGDVSLFKTNTKYLLIIDVKQNTLSYDIDMLVGHQTCVFPLSETKGKTNYKTGEVGRKVLTLTTNNNFDGVRCVQRFATSMDVSVPNETITYRMMFVEYQNGMENWDIPYFEGMTSVKMPVVTTTGKNLFDKSLRLGNINTNGDLIQSSSNIISNLIKVDGFKTYSISGIDEYVAKSKVYHIQYDGSGNLIKTGASFPFTTASNCKYIRIQINGTTDINGINSVLQIEQGSSTAYEPYKTNILTVNEDVELRGVGDVQDTLDLMTGELTERIGEVVLDGSEGWVLSKIKDNTQVFKLASSSKLKNIAKDGILMCDKLKPTSGVDDEIISFSSSLYMSLLKSKASTVEELKVYLSQNPITFIHKLATESVKTVDLSVVDENGNEIKYFMPIEGTMHIQTDGEPFKPSVTMEIPVEATTQNLASFIEMGV